MSEVKPIWDEEFLDERSRSLRLLVPSLVQTEDAAQDLEQRVWVEALKTKLDCIRFWRSWCRTVALNLIRTDARRKEKRRDEALSFDPMAKDAPAPEIVQQIELQESLMRALKNLPEPYQSILVLRFFSGMNAVEIAASRNAKPSSIRTVIHRGLGRLRDLMDEETAGSRRAWLVPMATFAGLRLPPAATSVPQISWGAAKLSFWSLMMKKAAVLGIVLLACFGVWLGSTDSSEFDDLGQGVPVTAVAIPDRSAARNQGSGGSDHSKTDLGSPEIAEGANSTLTVKRAFARGVVVGDHGNGVAGALVLLQPSTLRGGSNGVVHADKELSGAADAKTDDTGRFSIPIEGNDDQELFVLAQGFRPKRIRRPILDAETEVIRIQLEPMDSMFCVLLGPKGRPIPGASLKIDVETRSDQLPFSRFLRYVRQTAEDGTFSVPQFPLSTQGSFRPTTERVHATITGMPSRTWTHLQKLPHDRTGRTVLQLGVGRRLKLRFENKAGDLLPGINFLASMSSVGWKANGSVDAAGAAQLLEVPDQRQIEIATLSPEWVVMPRKGLLGNIVRDLEMPKNESDVLAVILEPACSVSGVVLDRDSGQGVSGVDVLAFSTAHVLADVKFLVIKARTDQTGHFRLTGLRAGGAILRVGSPGWCIDSGESKLALADGSTVDLEVGTIEKTGIEIPVRKAGVIRGRVVDDNGVGVAHVLVGVERSDLRPESMGGRSHVGVLTDDKGEFELANVPTGKAMKLVTQHRGYASSGFPFHLDSNTILDDAVLILGPGGQVKVRVEDGDGAPVAGVLVRLTTGDDRFSTVRGLRSGRVHTSTTNDNGQVEFDQVPLGQLTIHLSDQDSTGRRFSGHSEITTVKAGTQEVRVSLQVKELIRGIVRNTSGAPVRSTNMSFERNGKEVSQVIQTDAYGRFTVEADVKSGAKDSANDGKRTTYHLTGMYRVIRHPAGHRPAFEVKRYQPVQAPALYPRKALWELVVTRQK